MVDVKDKGLSNNRLINALLYEDAPRWTDLPTYGLSRPVITYYLDPTGGGDVWNGTEQLVMRAVFDSLSAVINVRFEQVFRYSSAQLVEYKERGSFFAPGEAGKHNPVDDFNIPFSDDQIEGWFNIQHNDWTGMTVGGSAFQTMLHEVMHGLGLDHPHEYRLLPGVPDGAEFGSLGTGNLNQVVYTNMSYNTPWGEAASGLVKPTGNMSVGGTRGPSALDIAALQYLYGANTTYRTGNDSYQLSDEDEVVFGPGGAPQGTSWLTIWDAGGADEIAYSGDPNDTIVHNATIDLRPATLRAEEGGGGFLSFVTRTDGTVVHGGFTIANGVDIENASGGDGNDKITGNRLDNWIWGNGGKDTLFGGAGRDQLFGGAGNDILNGEGGNDVMHGGIGDDVYNVDQEGDEVFEVAGDAGGTADKIYTTLDEWDLEEATSGVWVEILQYTGVGNFTGWGNALNNIIVGAGGRDYLDGEDGNDELYGDAGRDRLYGDRGNDRLDGGTGADYMDGGAGNDIYIVDNSGDGIQESLYIGVPASEQTDHVYASVSYTLGLSVENLTLTGGAIRGTGNAGDNVIRGNGSNNTLEGLGGNDTLDGGPGADIMRGSDGADLYYVDNSGDRVVDILATGGGSGGASADIDTVVSTIDYTLPNTIENLTLAGSAITGTGNRLDNRIDGNGSNNILYGMRGNDTLNGGAGADRMFGGQGNDTYYVDRSDDVIVENAGEGDDVVHSSAATYELSANLETLLLEGGAITGIGNGLANLIVGTDSVNNVLMGGGGADILNGGGGRDSLYGGTGDDTFLIDDPGDEVIESPHVLDPVSGLLLLGGTDHVYVYGDIVHYTLPDLVENLTLAGNAVTGTGNALSNRIVGNDFANTLAGLAGDDTITTGGGTDTVVLGDGWEDDVVTDFAPGLDLLDMRGVTGLFRLDQLTMTDTAQGVRIAFGGNSVLLNGVTAGQLGAASFLFNPGQVFDGTLFWGGTIQGGAGFDTVTYANANHPVSVNLQLGHAEGNGLSEQLISIERVIGSAFDDHIVGTTGADTLEGGAGNDILIGDSGIDKLFGMDGDDILVGDQSDIIDGGAGFDQVYAHENTIATGWSFILTPDLNVEGLSGNNGNDVLDASAMTASVYLVGFDGDDVVTGGGGEDYLVGDAYSFSPAGNDIMHGGAGSDRMYGYNGDDVMFGDGSNIAAGYGDQLWGGSGNDELHGGGSGWIIGEDGNDTLIGGDLDLVLGGAGNDTILGAAGTQQLDGGDGDDTLSGGADQDFFIFNPNFGRDTVTDFTSAGADHDVIQVSTALFADWNAIVAANALTDVAGNATLHTSDGLNVVTFVGVTSAQMIANHADDFVFV